MTRILSLALTPEAHPAAIPAFLYAKGGALLIPSCAEENPYELKPPTSF